jgi:hypothetical protein
MACELNHLGQALHRLVEQQRFVEAQELLPDYTRELDRALRSGCGEQVLQDAIATFHAALTKVRTARAHIAGELSDMNRARAYTGEAGNDGTSGWQLLG